MDTTAQGREFLERWLAAVEAGRPLAEEMAAGLAEEMLGPGVGTPDVVKWRASWVAMARSLFNMGMAVMRDLGEQHLQRLAEAGMVQALGGPGVSTEGLRHDH